MILLDLSSTIHRSLHGAIKLSDAKPIDGEIPLQQYIKHFVLNIFSDIHTVRTTHGNTYGELILCVDDKTQTNWRKDIFPMYKAPRSDARAESEINYKDVYKVVDWVIRLLHDHCGIKTVHAECCEADDIIMVLSQLQEDTPKNLIFSPDKDFIQCHVKDGKVICDQYSALTKKWIRPDSKGDDWVTEHICLGDVSDNVPRIVDFGKLSEAGEQLAFDKESQLYKDLQIDDTMNESEIAYKLSSIKWNEYPFEGYPFAKPRFGASTLKKAIEKHGGLEQWLNSDPNLKANYERNKKLVMAEGIPKHHVENILAQYEIPKNKQDPAALYKQLAIFDIPTKFFEDQFFTFITDTTDEIGFDW